MSGVGAGETEPLQDFEAKLNIQLLLEDGGENWYDHMERVAASVALTAGYGLHCLTGRESEIQAIREIMAEMLEFTVPSSSIVNFFPFLDYLPWEMPWRTRAKAFRERQEVLHDSLVNNAVNGKASGMNTWASVFVDQNKPEGDQRGLLKQFAGTFVLACILYPDWVVTAQKEIDAVVGSDRMPSLQDRPHLPYVEAVIREIHRWRPAGMAYLLVLHLVADCSILVRFGVPHCSVADDVIEYQGQEYFIPKGSIIFAVPWAIEHNQSVFEDHDRFMPERFLDSTGQLKPDYYTSAFGFGRRICPGIPFAERSIWADVVTMLWTFNIRGSDQPDPKTNLPFKYDDSDGGFIGAFLQMTSAPLRFPAVFEPRSSHRVEVAQREWAECEKDLNALLPAPKNE
ncbi:hypothetical protein H0H92_015024 [Tricholoma furcatifolium]|nr:hypothetical protein H0H92_015024 [Tricholoma furcatifolium]